MSPSDLSWFQQCLFFLLSVAAGYALNRCRIRRTKRGTTCDVELRDVENGITATPFADAQSSGGDEEARSPSNLSDPVGEAMASTGSLSSADRNRLRSESLRHPRWFLEPSAETRQTSPFLETGAQTEPPTFARRETADSSIVADRTPSPMSSSTAALLRPSGGEVESLSREIPLVDHAQARTMDDLRRRPERSKDRSRAVTHHKYEPRFKPRREKPESGTSVVFNYLPLGSYDTRREAEIVRHVAAVLYGKEEIRPPNIGLHLTIATNSIMR